MSSCKETHAVLPEKGKDQTFHSLGSQVPKHTQSAIPTSLKYSHSFNTFQQETKLCHGEVQMIVSPDLGSNPSSTDSSLSDLKPQLPDQMNGDKSIYFVELLGGFYGMYL